MPDPTTPQTGEQEQIKAAVEGADPTSQPIPGADPNAPGQDPLAPPGPQDPTAPPGAPGVDPSISGLSPDPTQQPAPGIPPAPGQPEAPHPAGAADPNAPGQDPLAPPGPQDPTAPPGAPGLPELPHSEAPTEALGSTVAGMQPSLMEGPGPSEGPEPSAQGAEEAPELPGPEQGADPYAAAPQGQDQGYYDPYSGGGGDAISEVAEQIVAEKLAPIRRAVEDTLDHRTTVEAKLTHLNERLKRIENIIDQLQLSILQKVGEYVTNVSDLKKEVIETQKSFKSMHKRNKKR